VAVFDEVLLLEGASEVLVALDDSEVLFSDRHGRRGHVLVLLKACLEVDALKLVDAAESIGDHGSSLILFHLFLPLSRICSVWFAVNSQGSERLWSSYGDKAISFAVDLFVRVLIDSLLALVAFDIRHAAV